ncbi:hypothetical protein Tco_0508893, partial [Tanacetum coccineum]
TEESKVQLVVLTSESGSGVGVSLGFLEPVQFITPCLVYDLAPRMVDLPGKDLMLRLDASLEVLEDFFSFNLESLEDSTSLLDFLLFFP